MSQPVVRRFWNKVDMLGDCWTWTASRHRSRNRIESYGQFINDKGKNVSAHRWVYENHIKAIPNGMCVLHCCDNMLCVRPSHLFLGTQADNIADMISKGRQAKGEKHCNAVLTESDVLEIRRMYAFGNYSQAALARKFGVISSQISRIVNRKRWKHI